MYENQQAEVAESLLGHGAEALVPGAVHQAQSVHESSQLQPADSHTSLKWQSPQLEGEHAEAVGVVAAVGGEGAGAT